MAKKAANTLPSLLSYSRSFMLSNGMLYGVYPDERQDVPLVIERYGLRTTISDFKNGHTNKGAEDIEKTNDINAGNLQATEVCRLPVDCDSFAVEFTLTFLPNAREATATNDDDFAKRITDIVTNYYAKGGANYLAERYVENVAKAGFLWRNGYAADQCVTVTVKNGPTFTFHPQGMDAPLSDEDQKSADALAELVAAAIAGKSRPLFTKIRATGYLGDGAEVFPSQAMNTNSDGKQLRYRLFNGVEHAMIGAEKLSNAVRRIDDWYGEGEALAVEPYGVNRRIGRAMRNPTDGIDLYSYLMNLDKVEADVAEAESFEGMDPSIHFVVACLIRGGVYSGGKPT